MKRIFFWNKINGRTPFWQPWGCLGCLGRVIGFLLLLLALLFLLSLFRKCEDTNPYEGGGSDPIADNWNRPIENGEDVGLPSPEHNTPPPFQDIEPIINPEDSLTEIYPNLLYAIFDTEDDQVEESFTTFAKKFSLLYPAPEHKITVYNTGTRTMVLEVPVEKRDEICENLPSQIQDVKFHVIPIEVMGNPAPASAPNDPVFKNAKLAWFFKPIQACEAWNITQGSSEITVGIVDSYMDLRHPELNTDRCVYPYSVIKQNSDVLPERGVPEDVYGHGTLVTAVAVGNSNNNKGSSGIAPKCKFIPVSLGQNMNTYTIAEGLLYCMYHNADVINISIGAAWDSIKINRMSIDQQINYSKTMGKRCEKMWDYIFDMAEKRNTTIVWAAGNDHCFDAMDNSKRNSKTIRVSAVDRHLRRADFSNFGNFRDKGLYESTISAPGVDIFGALPDNKYGAWPGTSFSAPIITGVVALIKSQNKDLTTQQIIKILQSTGKPVSGAPEIGNLVQIKDALLKAKQTVASGTTETSR